jgi:hypothetical protein
MDWDILHYDIDVEDRPKSKKLSAIILAHYCKDGLLKKGTSNSCNRCSGSLVSFRITNLEFQKRKATERSQKNKIY